MGFKDMVKNILNIPEDDYYDDIEDEDVVEYTAGDRATSSAASRQRVANTVQSNQHTSGNNVVNIHTTAQLQVVLVKPEAFADASAIADHLNNKRTVVLNLESATREIARRLVDFLSGVAYANGGQLKRVANSTYIITPYNVDVMGDLIDELENSGVYF